MVQIEKGGTNKIGDTRRKYLELAGDSYAYAERLIEYEKVTGFMNAFEFTLEAGSEAKKEIMRKKEQIDIDRREAIRAWEQWKEGLSYFEQFDVQPERDKIEIKAVGQRLEACWDIGKRYGLFND